MHYLAEGRHHGLAPLPPVLPVREVPPTLDRRPRRACLFAGFDGDGIVDDYVVAYVRELSRHADVYYLADCRLEDGELDKLAPYTRGRWTIRHGRYDFGSYAMLARDLVGWDTLAGYDEVLLTNDSSYLLRPLDQIFDTMDARPAHWWGLQATDDDFTPRDQERLGRRLRVDDLAEESRRERPWRMSDCFHVGSYFMALRSDVIADPEFRRRLETVAPQSDKNSIIRKYEIGISSYLTLAGYHVETFVDGVLPFHPIYRESAFDLLDEGFPFVKRQFLHENPFHVTRPPQLEGARAGGCPGCRRRRHRAEPVAGLPVVQPPSCPDGDVVANGYVHATEELIGPDNFDDLERFMPRFDHWWAFAVNPRTRRLEGNARSVFEAVRLDPTIKKVLIGPTENPGIGGANVAAVLSESQGAHVVSAPRRHHLRHRGSASRPAAPASRRQATDSSTCGHTSSPRTFGAGLERGTSAEARLRHNQRLHDLDLTRVVCASSERQAQALRPCAASPFKPEIRVTGSPRTDLLLLPGERARSGPRAQLDVLRRARAGRRLVVWAPADRA